MGPLSDSVKIAIPPESKYSKFQRALQADGCQAPVDLLYLRRSVFLAARLVPCPAAARRVPLTCGPAAEQGGAALFRETRMHIPSLLLAKLYVKGTLRNTEEGFQFTVKNVLAPGTAVDFRGLEVDGTEYRAADVSLLVEGAEAVDAVAVSSRAPLSLSLGTELIVKVRGQRLSTGPREILLTFLTREVGELTVPIRDTISS